MKFKKGQKVMLKTEKDMERILGVKCNSFYSTLPGFLPEMWKHCGKHGVVYEILNNGTLRIEFGDYTWAFMPDWIIDMSLKKDIRRLI